MHFQLSSSKKKCLNHNTKLLRKYVLATWPNKSGFGAKSEYTIFVYSGKIIFLLKTLEFNSVSLEMIALLIIISDLHCIFTVRKLKYIIMISEKKSALPVG